jgi:hypothetical protein
MTAAIDPAHDSRAVDRRGAGQLRAIAQTRSAPVLRESCRAVFGTATAEVPIGEELEQVEIAQTHRTIAAFVLVADACCRRCVLSAERSGFFLRPDRHEGYGKIRMRVGLFERAQLRERFAEEGSTDVPEPHRQPGKPNPELAYRRRRRVAGGGCF